jgi:hypothetical protein
MSNGDEIVARGCLGLGGADTRRSPDDEGIVLVAVRA